MDAMTVKISIIEKIANYHPGYNAGLKRGWSKYVGGMEDRGEWDKWKMLKEATIGQLEECLTDLEKESKPVIPAIPYRTNEELMGEMYTNLQNRMMWGQ